MPQLFPPEIIENTAECYHAQISNKSKIIYVILLIMLFATVTSLPFIYVDVSSQSRGVIRTPFDNTSIQTALYGEIVKYNLIENKSVEKGDTLIMLNIDKLNEQNKLTTDKITETDLFIADITALLNREYGGISSAKYRGEYQQYRAKIKELQTSVNYLKRELNTQKILSDKKVISEFEYLQSQNNFEKANEQLRTFQEEYRNKWTSERTTLELQRKEFQSSILQIEKEKRQYTIVAPTSGTLIQVAGFQKGNFIAPGQTLAYISTRDSLLAECYISPTDIGYIRNNQKVTLQFDAFNYNDWGMIEGSVREILHDITMVNDQPMFRVRCHFSKKSLKLKNGYEGNIQKGLTFTARFQLTERSLWQLLFDKIDNWLNPKLLTSNNEN